MKTKTNLSARPLLAPFLALAVTSLQMPACAAAAADTSSRHSSDHAGKPQKASDIIGLKLENNEGQKVGDVEDLAIDLQSGRIVQIIVSTGGFLSMGERYNAVPPSRVQWHPTDKSLRFDITREKLKAAPAFDMSAWKEFYQSERVQEAYRYYGDEFAPETDAASRTRTGALTSANGLGHVHRATKLQGLSVQNLQDQKIGTVDNLIVDLPAARVVAVIVSSGGFLGLGDTLSVVPPTVLRFVPDHDGLRLDTTKEALRDAPRFKSNEWPDFSQGDYTAGVYRAYNQEPYAARAVDNAERNTRDRGGRTLTPADQGGSVSDVTLTQEIRKAVVATDGLSMNAKNVKIITVNGRVTLRGPVRTAAEKASIAAIAARFAQSSNVDDQLEVTGR